MQWYKHYLDDYDRDTSGLSLIEHGAYRALLDAYYQREGPLPCDRQILYRICRAQKKTEKRAVETIIGIYFRNSDGTLKHKRADEEILKYQQRCLANRRPNRQRIEYESSQNLEVRKKKEESTTSKPVDKYLTRPAFLYKSPTDLT